MEKCGMRLVRTFRADWPVEIPGSEHGDVEYAIERLDWLRCFAPPHPVRHDRPAPHAGEG